MVVAHLKRRLDRVVWVRRDGGGTLKQGVNRTKWVRQDGGGTLKWRVNRAGQVRWDGGGTLQVESEQSWTGEVGWWCHPSSSE